jgi:hypothetical protein
MLVEIIVKGPVQGHACERARIRGVEAATQFVGRLIPDRERKPRRRDPEIVQRENRCQREEKADGGKNSRRQFVDPRFAWRLTTVGI